MFCCLVLALLKKYYQVLLANFPEDHVTTVSILSETVPVSEVFFDDVISLTDHNLANEKILNAMIMMMNRDSQIGGFCQLAKLLIRRDGRSSKELLEFEIGKCHTVCT